MGSRQVVLEFHGGPLDGFRSEWIIDEALRLPEMLIGRTPMSGGYMADGTYHISVNGPHFYTYCWSESAP